MAMRKESTKMSVFFLHMYSLVYTYMYINPGTLVEVHVYVHVYTCTYMYTSSVGYLLIKISLPCWVRELPDLDTEQHTHTCTIIAQ